MLVSFAVSNFRSFAARQVFSLIASRRLREAHDGHIVPLPDSDREILRAGVIYGANGAGKSNLFAALGYARHLALAHREESGTTARVPFRFGEFCHQPSTFDLQFVAADKHYRYSVSVDSARIVEERLTHIVEGRERLIYVRRNDSAGHVKVDAPGLKNEGAKLQALITVGGRQNQSFLATARATLERSDIGKTLTEVIQWLDTGLALIGPEPTLDRSVARLVMDEGFRQFAGEFLKASATGISHLNVVKEEISADEIRMLLPEELLHMRKGTEHAFSILRVSNGTELLVERTADGKHFYNVAIQAVHKPANYEEKAVPLDEESDGTRRLLELIPALYQRQAGASVCFIDEIDRSLHPLLVYRYLEYFLRTCTRSPCQIIVTTHASDLLDLDLLRRDEIWFAQKNASAATHLYTLKELNVRSDLQVRKAYLAGRFGAVPVVGALDRLFEKDSGRRPSGRGGQTAPSNGGAVR